MSTEVEISSDKYGKDYCFDYSGLVVEPSLSAEEREIYDQEMVREEGFVPLIWDRVEQLDLIFGGGDEAYHKRAIGGRTILELVEPVNGNEPKCRIAYRMYHETTWWYAADWYASEAIQLLRELGIGGPDYKTLSLNTGLGTSANALIANGFSVEATVENNSIIREWAKESWERLNERQNGMRWILDDAKKVVKVYAAEKNNRRFDFVDMDPPFQGIFDRKRRGLRDLGNIWPDAKVIIPRAFEITPVAGMKVPSGVPTNEVYRCARELNASVRVLEWNGLGNKRRIQEKYLLFVRGDVSGSEVRSEAVREESIV